MKTPWNPSRKATARVKNPLPTPIQCNICGEMDIAIVNNKDIYGREYGDWPWVYLCRCCGSTVGMHPFTNIPLGTLANKETRGARKLCKAPFELLHKNGLMTRDHAYTQLANKLGIKKEECHFGWFDAAICLKAKNAAEEIIRECEN